MKRVLYTFSLLAIVAVFSQCNKLRTPTTCTESPKADCICTMDYDPVCGCNDVTYSNACDAACHGISDITKGACK